MDACRIGAIRNSRFKRREEGKQGCFFEDGMFVKFGIVEEGGEYVEGGNYSNVIVGLFGLRLRVAR